MNASLENFEELGFASLPEGWGEIRSGEKEC